MAFSQILLWAALLKLAVCQTAGECADRVECFVNPCDAASCPNYIDAECTPNYCYRECRAEFFLPNGRNVTDKCEIPSCETRICPENRPVCVEERVPCPNNKPFCVPSKQVKVTCEKLPLVFRPSDCDTVVCADDQRCAVDETAEGPVAHCVAQLPERCDEIECKPGTECRERVKDGIMSVKCVAVRIDAEDCTSVACPENTVCQLTGAGRPRCVEKPPPSSCERLTCEEGYQCVVRNERRAACVQIQMERPQPTKNVIQELVANEVIGKDCGDIDCLPGYHCVMFGDINIFGDALIPRCVPNNCPRTRAPRTCQELECGPDEYCLTLAAANGFSPQCFPYGKYTPIVPP